ncbi:uncharacterized protein LOC143306595 [Osmia lignaria lignaria]|uniref:uncharacterized protein LOC143306595 n=1 Tax=Osmia lignaria lignaria TaxID=1437193 RepID=UPI00402B62A7
MGGFGAALRKSTPAVLRSSSRPANLSVSPETVDGGTQASPGHLPSGNPGLWSLAEAGSLLGRMVRLHPDTEAGQVTHLAWETSLANSKDIPPFHQLAAFLENQIQAMDAAQLGDPLLHPAGPKSAKEAKPKVKEEAVKKRSSTTVLTAAAKSTQPRKCPSCSGNHSLGYCYKFKALAPSKRKERAQTLKACSNCLTVGHDSSKCPSKQSCLACSGRHHTLLYDALKITPSTSKQDTMEAVPTGSSSSLSDEPSSATSLSLTAGPRSAALLATAKVKLEAPSGETLEVRALLDTGSDASLVSSWVVQALRLPRRAVRVAISGVQENQNGVSTGEVSLVVRPRQPSGFRLPVRALVLRKLTSLLPAHRIAPQPWPHLKGLPLADPEYGVPARVDLILGADVCGALFADGTRTGFPGTPTAKLTPFGWVLMGAILCAPAQEEARTFHCRTEANVGQLLQRFWELEEVHNHPTMSEEEERCARHFKGTHARDAKGRYVVRLPFVREPAASLKPSRTSALKLLFNCERRLASDNALKDKCGKFLEEYLSLQHMKTVPEAAKEEPAYYLPHHAVVKRHDPTAKLRVVFNASFRTASGYSLNDCLSAGPKLQADLWMVLTRWRIFKVVFTTDVVKMFRQIQVHPEDTKWQRILWRTGPDERVQDFQLITVTYGTACAPFLALRVLNQLAEDEGDRLPLGAGAIRRHTYVDDILAGADNVNEALRVKHQVIQIFKAGGFDLSKWASNVPKLRENGASDQHLFQEWPGIATLGVNWDPTTDSFSLRVAPPADSPPASTKRSILSEVASLFDPLGWVAPVLVTAKILMQAWTDSSVCLYWIRGHASQWKPFVAHRVSAIQSELPPDLWRHVASSDNPADLATRGISPADLLKAELWWHGPSWLPRSASQWPAERLEKSGAMDLAQSKLTVHLAVEDKSDELLTMYSSLSRLLTVLAYCFRFSNLARKRPCESGFIKAEERASAL